jgi:hypothetical protein
MTSSIENLALSKAQGLTSVKAVDEAHFAIIDAYIDELMAPLYEAAERDWQFGLRVLEGLNAQGLEEAARTCGKAKNAARKAQAAENEFAVVYRHWVGTEPVTDTTMAPFDHRQYRQHWDAERLQLAADKGVLGQTAWGFRGTVTQACPPVIPDQAPRNEQ